MHNSSPLVLVDSATNMPLTSVTGDLTFSTVFVKGSSAAESLSSAMTSGPSWTDTYDVTGGAGGNIDIMTDGVEYATNA